MHITIQSLVLNLQSCDPLVGIPLGLIGVLLTGAGWRVRAGALPASFGLVGIWVGFHICRIEGQEWFYAASGFVIVGVLGHMAGEWSVVILGGLIGAGMVNCLAGSLGLLGATLWVATAIGLFSGVALSFVDLRRVVILITSFEGTVLVVMAGVIFCSDVPWVTNQFRGTSWGWSVVVAFTLLVPTVIGVMLQLADAAQKDRGLVRA